MVMFQDDRKLGFVGDLVRPLQPPGELHAPAICSMLD
jgi:hypothetical protein